MKKLLFVLLLILFPTISFASISPETAKQLAVKYAEKYNVDPAFLIAVMHIESRKGNQEFRFGRIGKIYYGPCAIHKDFLKKWAIDDPETNIEVGARALRNVGYDDRLQKKRLYRYNTICDPAYVKAVMQAKQKYRRELKK